MAGPFDAFSEGVGRGMQFYLEGRRRKEEKSRYGIEREEEKRRYEREQTAMEGLRELQKRQTEQSMRLTGEQAERERAYMFPGREETTGFTGTRPYTVKGQEPGLGYQAAKTELAAGKKTLAEPTFEEKQDILHKHAMAEIEARRAAEAAAEEKAIPFDESGGFNPQIFNNISKGLFGEFTFRDVYDNLGLEEVRKQIRFEAVGAHGQNDPAKVKQIESSLDEWLRILFQVADTMPEEEKISLSEKF